MTIATVALLTTVSLVAVGTLPPGGQDAAYAVKHTSAASELMELTDESWDDALPIEWGAAPYTTRFRALWSPTGLWLRFDVSDRDPWHTLNERDARLWEEEVVEIFIDPDGDGRNYVEIEINPANAVCDLLVHSAQPELDNSIEWDFEGLRTKVYRGPDGEDWTAVAHLPWDGFRRLPGAAALQLPPRPGNRWRFNVFRIKRPGGPDAPQAGAVYAAWSPPPGLSFHVPEVFRDMEFE